MGGPPEQPAEAEPDPNDLIHRFASPPRNRKRRPRAAQQPDLPGSAAEPATGAQIAAQVVHYDPSSMARAGGGRGGQEEGPATDQFASQYELAMMRVQKSREMQSVNNSLANTS